MLTVFILTAGTVRPLQAQTSTVLYSFTGGTDGALPFGGLVHDSAGNLYGTTVGAGEGGLEGSVFKLNRRGKFKLLYSFAPGGAGGARPSAGLVRDSAGNLYGTTPGWGSSPATVFQVTRNGKFSVLYSFTGGAGGSDPGAVQIASQVHDQTTTVVGGGPAACRDSACGVVFKLDPYGNETVLYTFVPQGSSGYGPEAGITMDSAGNLYGTASLGGSLNDCQGEGCGVVFKITP